MNTKNNKRWSGTQEHIEACFLRLIAREEPNGVSVKRLCEFAEINRSTFYAHYDDIFALQRSIEDKRLLDIVDLSVSPDQLPDHIWSREFFLTYLARVKQHQNFYIKFLRNYFETIRNDKYEASFARYLENREYDRLSPVWERNPVPLKDAAEMTPEERKLTYSFYEAGVTMLILQWLESGCKTSLECVCDFIIRMIER